MIEFFSFDIFLILLIVSLASGFVDAIAGGGGLITIPALLLMNMNPVAALATNKLQGTSGAFMAAYTMQRKGLYKIREVWGAAVFAGVGSFLGAVLIQHYDVNRLEMIIPFVLGFMALYFMFVPTCPKQLRERIGQKAYHIFVMPLIGFYDGAFGPGTGSFFTLAGVGLRGREIVWSNAAARLLNFATNIVALILFVLSGKVVWSYGLIMAVGQLIGARGGALVVASEKGSKIIKPVIVVVCLLMLAQYVRQKVL